MCEVPIARERKPGPLTPNMRALLARMAEQPDEPVLWDYGHDTRTLNGQAVPGVSFNGLVIRGLLEREHRGGRVIGYRLNARTRRDAAGS